MSQKKLQQEIDKLLKKVKEGLEEFEIIYDKFQITDPSNSSYREKLEGDLKREIKKLQKHREQIKTWLSKEDVKDKSSVLMENRKLIENGMERFKSIEKLMKTKQFSKEALTNPDIIRDPKEMLKNEQTTFIHDSINELQKQLEAYEVKFNDASANDYSQFEEKIKRHEFHIINLENILRLLQSNEYEAEKVDEFREDITYYVENNDDPDFVEYDTLYEDMDCEIQPEAPADNTKPLKQEKSPKKKKPILKDSTSIETNKSNILNFTESQDITSAIDSANETLEKKKDENEEDEEEEEEEEEEEDEEEEEETKQQLELSFPEDRSQDIQQEIENDIIDNPAFQNPLFSDELRYWLESKRTLLQPHKEMPQTMVSQLESSLLNCPDSLDADSPYLYKNPLSLPHPTSIFFPNEPIRFVYPFDVDPKNASDQSPNNQAPNQDQITNQGENNRDSEKNNATQQRNDIYTNTSLAKIFSKFDLDTLFFIFYHYQGSYEQFLASRELNKNRNWQFNKVDRCWYYKEIEKLPPGMIKSEEESWRYFDYRKSWLARRCGPDFTYNENDFEKLWY